MLLVEIAFCYFFLAFGSFRALAGLVYLMSRQSPHQQLLSCRSAISPTTCRLLPTAVTTMTRQCQLQTKSKSYCVNWKKRSIGASAFALLILSQKPVLMKSICFCLNVLWNKNDPPLCKQDTNLVSEVRIALGVASQR